MLNLYRSKLTHVCCTCIRLGKITSFFEPIFYKIKHYYNYPIQSSSNLTTEYLENRDILQQLHSGNISKYFIKQLYSFTTAVCMYATQ